MLGNVGDPQPIWSLAREHSLDQIGGHVGLVAGPGPPIARQSLELCPRHQQLDLVVTDRQPQTEGQLSVDPAGTVGATRGGVHGLDLVGEPGVADRAC